MQNVSFTGLKGFSKDNNPQNLTTLTKFYGTPFVEALGEASAKINSIAGDSDVFLKTSEYGDIDIVDENDESYATAEFNIDGTKPFPEDIPDICRSAFADLAFDFIEAYDVKKATGELKKIIDTYA